MKKKIWLIVLAVVAIGAVTYLVIGRQHKAAAPAPAAGAFDPLNAAYLVENESVTLANGKAHAPAAPGSAEQVMTSVFGQPVVGDLNGDGKPDAAMIITQESGGSGTFYYVVAAIDSSRGAVGTNAVLLGDRIAPQNIAIQNGRIVMNYADRNPGEPMSAPPSVGVTKYFSLNGATLQEAPPVAGAGAHCGGNIANAAVCVAGYHCAPAAGSHLPFGDVGGICVAN